MWTGEQSLVYLKTNPKDAILAAREVQRGNAIGDSYIIPDDLKNSEN